MKTFAVAMGLAVGLLATAADAKDGFIKRQTRIKGCTAIIDAVKNGNIDPTPWLDQNKEEFKDLELELRDRGYKPAKAQAMMMGKAISLCMQEKGYRNKCVADEDNEDADLQDMETAIVYACWTRRTAVIQEPFTPPPPPPGPPQATVPPLPPMSPPDMAQFSEDWSIISQPVRFIGDDEGGAKEARFGSCASYWQSLHHNRPPDVRHILYSVRVARCMFRTNYAVLPIRCQGGGFGAMLRPGCYARFG